MTGEKEETEEKGQSPMKLLFFRSQGPSVLQLPLPTSAQDLFYSA